MNQQVSTIIPVYNGEKFIAQTIDSVLTQTYASIELIVVNDGSTDSTSDVLKKYEGRIICFDQVNSGGGAARNAGLAVARGKYVAFLDADDQWVPEKIEKQVCVMEANPHLGFVCSGSYVVDAADNILGEWCRRPKNLQETFEALYDRNFVLNLTVMARRDCLMEVGGSDPALRISFDYDLWLRLAKKFPFKYLCEPLARYRVHSAGLSRNQRGRYRDNIKIINKAEIAAGISSYTRWIRNAKIHYYFGDVFLGERKCFTAGMCFMKALLICPFIGAYYRPLRTRYFCFSLFHGILRVYWLVLRSLGRGIRQAAGYKIPQYNPYQHKWCNT
jgi:glycosyltransferase involved in cell wall biosynthesis